MTGEVIAIIGEKIVGHPLELLGDFFNDVLNIVLRAEGEALQ